MEIVSKIEKKPLVYMREALERACSNGDAYTTVDELYQCCKKVKGNLPYNVFRSDLNHQVRSDIFRTEGLRIYSKRTWRYEDSAAKKLSEILMRPGISTVELPDVVTVGDIVLCSEQRDAVFLALSNRLSLILGGAGCGKSTLIRAICDNKQKGEGGGILCAPTGKAARNLTDRTKTPARTVHSALGLTPDDDFLGPVEWEYVQLVVVDEASMLSLEMLAGILNRANADCRIVLLGDPNQLQAVGTGNIIPDLLALGVPSIRLEVNHRQDDAARALIQNVVNFNQLQCGRDLVYDSSFILETADEAVAIRNLVEEAARRYLTGENIQVLAPYNSVVSDLNRQIRERVNPKTDEMKVLSNKREVFRDGDRVLITKNSRDKNCSNGDVGILHIYDDDINHPVYSVELRDGRCPKWKNDSGLYNMTLAYALTVHKSQGSEYDAILMPVSMSMLRMLSRNLFYTAISRAKRQVILYGNPQAIDVAMQTTLPPRRSMLPTKVHMQMHHCA